MDKSAAWKLALLNDALPKYTAAIQACKNHYDTSEAKAPTRAFLKLVEDIVFPNSVAYSNADPQEHSKEDS